MVRQDVIIARGLNSRLRNFVFFIIYLTLLKCLYVIIKVLFSTSIKLYLILKR
jgi:hypothetical protein